MGFLKPKLLLKLAWLGFGLAGLYIVAQKYFPNFPAQLKDSSVVKGVQSELAETTQTSDFSSQSDQINLQNLDPQTASQVISQVIKRQITQVIQEASTEVKQFPQKTVRKIKIGACEELLEEDICAVAQELDCSSN
jgi:hypothetical protein